MPYAVLNEIASTIAVGEDFEHGVDTSIVLTDASAFDAGGGYIRIDDGTEWALYEYTGKSGNTLTGLTPCTLGNIESTATHTFAAGTDVMLVVMAENLQDLLDLIPGGADTQIQFNDNGILTGDSSLVWDKTNKLLTATKTGIGATQGDYGIALVNTTDAAAGAQQYSPPIRWRGQGWKTGAEAASQTVDFRVFVRPIQGATAPTGGLDFQASINGGAYSDLVTILSNGNVGMGMMDPEVKLQVAGNDFVSSTVYQHRAGDSVSPPTYRGMKSRGTISIPAVVQDGDSVYQFEGRAYDGAAWGQVGAIIFKVDGGVGSDDTPGRVEFHTTNDGSNTATIKMTIKNDGSVGIGTTTPDGPFAVNQGAGTAWADQWSPYSCSKIKEDIVEVGSGYLEKLRNVPAYSYRQIPYVSADELRQAAIDHFGPQKWQAEFGGEIDEKTRKLRGDQYRGGKLQEIKDQELLAFVDSTADQLRQERRKLPKWQRKHLGLIADYPELEANWPEAVGYSEDDKILGINLTGYIGVLHATMREMLSVIDDQQMRIEALEAV